MAKQEKQIQVISMKNELKLIYIDSEAFHPAMYLNISARAVWNKHLRWAQLLFFESSG